MNIVQFPKDEGLINVHRGCPLKVHISSPHGFRVRHLSGAGQLIAAEDLGHRAGGLRLAFFRFGDGSRWQRS